MMGKGNTVVILLITVITGIAMLFFNIYILSAISIALFAFITLVFLNKVGSEIPIRDLILVILLIQMVI